MRGPNERSRVIGATVLGVGKERWKLRITVSKFLTMISSAIRYWRVTVCNGDFDEKNNVDFFDARKLRHDFVADRKPGLVAGGATQLDGTNILGSARDHCLYFYEVEGNCRQAEYFILYQRCGSSRNVITSGASEPSEDHVISSSKVSSSCPSRNSAILVFNVGLIAPDVQSLVSAHAVRHVGELKLAF